MSHRARVASMHEMEFKLHAFLGIPFSPRGGESAVPRLPGDLSDLVLDVKSELAALRRESDRIGKIPENYPRHITWLMRLISALLPWYTRPLVNFSRRTSATAELMSDLLDAVLHRQNALDEEIRALRSGR